MIHTHTEIEVHHITCNMCIRDLPDVYALSPRALLTKSLVPMLQLLHTTCSFRCVVLLAAISML